MKCYQHYKQIKNKCLKKTCRYWVDCSDYQNCALNVADKSEKLTLEDVGKMFNVTRMRICQIEKQAIKKLKDKIKEIM